MKRDIYTPSIGAWSRRKELLEDEVEFTPWAELGWNAWNGMSPELEVVDFFARLVRLLKPKLVVETGVGQGYMTRAIVPMLEEGQMLLSYESNPEWHALMQGVPFWKKHRKVARLADEPSPGIDTFLDADLCFLDSDFSFRLPEIDLWHHHAKSGAVALIHDTGERHADVTMHVTVKERIIALEMPGFFLHNPRGCFFAIHP